MLSDPSHSGCRSANVPRRLFRTKQESKAGGPLSAESLVAGLPENINHRLEGEPLRDLLAAAQPAAELRAGKLRDLLALLLGLALLDVALLGPDVDHVLVVRHRHTQLRGVLLARLLCVVRAV